MFTYQINELREKKMMKEHNPHQIGNIYIHKCISKYIPTCQKHINNINKLKKTQTGNNKTMKNNNTNTNHHSTPNTSNTNLKDTILKNTIKNQQTTMIQNHETTTSPLQYLNVIQPHIPQELISQQNYEEIKNIAGHFKGNLSSFFGFEVNLMNYNPSSDYLFAISSRNNEREELLTLLQKKELPEKILEKKTWNNVKIFTEKWIEKDTKINKNILGLWFEFDASNTQRDIKIPGIFTHTVSIKRDSDITWVVDDLLPLCNGRRSSIELKSKIQECVRKLPAKASIYQIGIMLQRKNKDIRLVIKRINHNEIIPYLESIGWNDDTGKIQNLIKNLEKYCSRIVLHISVGDKIDSKIGLECSFYPDEKGLNEKWRKFFEFLVKNEYSKPDKIGSILNFQGVEYDYGLYDQEDIVTKMKENPLNIKTIRFISHIKILYEPNSKIQSKAYFGVRKISEK
jgi:hypothetical protein